MDVSRKTAEKGRYFLLASAFSAIILTPTSLHSGTQGSLGSTSSASMTITLIIPPKLETQTASEIAVSNPEIPSATSVNDAVPLCVSSNGLPSYTVTASGHMEEGRFALQNGNNLVPYDVMLWKDADSSPQQLSSGQASQPLPPLARNQRCEGSSQLALKMRQPIDPNQSITGAVNLTISAD